LRAQSRDNKRSLTLEAASKAENIVIVALGPGNE
jgi:hypothetical protein